MEGAITTEGQQKETTAPVPCLEPRILPTKDSLAFCKELLWDQAVTERSSVGAHDGGGGGGGPCLEVLFRMGMFSFVQSPVLWLQLSDRAEELLYLRTWGHCRLSPPWSGEGGGLLGREGRSSNDSQTQCLSRPAPPGAGRTGASQGDAPRP